MKSIAISLGLASTFFLLTACSGFRNPLSQIPTPTRFPIYQNGKLGYIDGEGEVVIRPQFVRSSGGTGYFFEGLAVACVDSGKCGFINESGEFAINPQFEKAGNFSEGLASVFVDRKLGYITKEGEFAVNPQFDQPGNGPEEWVAISAFSEGLAVAKIGNKHGYIDKTGSFIINPEYSRAFPFSDGLGAVSTQGGFGFLDKMGRFLINPQFDHAFPFTEGLAAVQVGKKFGFINREGKFEINPQFDAALPFYDGMAWVAVGKKSGFIGLDGKYEINPQFDLPGGPMPGLFVVGLKQWVPKTFLFSEGLAPVMVGDKTGYVDNKGKFVINPRFSFGMSFYGGLALVRLDVGGKLVYAYVDKFGKIVWQEKPAGQKQR